MVSLWSRIFADRGYMHRQRRDTRNQFCGGEEARKLSAGFLMQDAIPYADGLLSGAAPPGDIHADVVPGGI